MNKGINYSYSAVRQWLGRLPVKTVKNRNRQNPKNYQNSEGGGAAIRISENDPHAPDQHNGETLYEQFARAYSDLKKEEDTVTEDHGLAAAAFDIIEAMPLQRRLRYYLTLSYAVDFDPYDLMKETAGQLPPEQAKKILQKLCRKVDQLSARGIILRRLLNDAIVAQALASVSEES